MKIIAQDVGLVGVNMEIEIAAGDFVSEKACSLEGGGLLGEALVVNFGTSFMDLFGDSPLMVCDLRLERGEGVNFQVFIVGELRFFVNSDHTC